MKNMSDQKNRQNTETYQKYLERKHGSFNTPVHLIEKAIANVTKSKIVKKIRIVEGEINEVYEVLTDDDKSLIVRISRSEHPSFDAEKNVIKLVRLSGIPAPRVLTVDELSYKGKRLTFCIEEKLEGVPLKILMPDIDQNILRSLIIEAGEILSKINSITEDRFGSLNRITPFKTWPDYIFSLETKEPKIITAAGNIGIDTNYVKRAFEIIRKNDILFDLKEPKLLHGDFSPKHLLIKGNHITGIIDFENAKGGDPVRDLSWVNFFYGDSFPIEWLKEGYSEKCIFDNNFDLKMKLYRLHIGLDLLDYYASEDNIAGLNHTKVKFLEELKGF
jgi:aminoglycoside phosphotransferase (APT) family kinase protein